MTTITPPVPAPVAPAQPARRKHLPLILAAVLLTATAGGAGTYALMQHSALNHSQHVLASTQGKLTAKTAEQLSTQADLQNMQNKLDDEQKAHDADKTALDAATSDNADQAELISNLQLCRIDLLQSARAVANGDYATATNLLQSSWCDAADAASASTIA